MTPKELELMTGLYALLDRIDAEDKATAILIVEHLLNVVSPLSPPLATSIPKIIGAHSNSVALIVRFMENKRGRG